MPPPDTLTLLARHRAGDPDALRELITRYYPRITRIVRIRMGKKLAAFTTVDDVVQCVLVRIVKGVDSFVPRSDGSWVAWVATLSGNEISNQARRLPEIDPGDEVRIRIREFADSAMSLSLTAKGPGVSTIAESREMGERIDRCLGELNEAYRDLILLKDFACCTWEEIATEKGKTKGACQQIYARACIALAKCVKARR